MAFINSATCPDLESELRLGRSKIIVHVAALLFANQIHRSLSY
jgi:hypothetical protein